MSEEILKSLLKLFAAVARQDDVTHQERQEIVNFLNDHLNQTRVDEYLKGSLLQPFSRYCNYCIHMASCL